MTEATTAANVAAVTEAPAPGTGLSPIAVFTIPGIEGEKQFDCSTMPGEARMHLLRDNVRKYISNAVNSTVQRHAKDEAVIAWAAYDAAQEADAFQTAVAKPEGERPGAPDLVAAYDAAIDRLVKGEIRTKGSGEGRTRAPKDPLVAAVTTVVERELFKSKHAEDAKYTFLEAKKEVGGDGIAYLKARVDTLAEAGGDRAALEKMLDEKYVKPAKVMLGLTEGKTISALPQLI